MGSAAAKKLEIDGRQIVVQCPSCATRFSIASNVIEGVSSPRFHCSRCDHVFALPDFIFETAKKTAESRPSTPVPQTLEDPPAPALPVAGSTSSSPENRGHSSAQTPSMEPAVSSADTTASHADYDSVLASNVLASATDSPEDPNLVDTLVFESPLTSVGTSAAQLLSDTSSAQQPSGDFVDQEPPAEIRALLSSAERVVEEQRIERQETTPRNDVHGAPLSKRNPTVLNKITIPSPHSAAGFVAPPRESDTPVIPRRTGGSHSTQPVLGTTGTERVAERAAPISRPAVENSSLNRTASFQSAQSTSARLTTASTSTIGAFSPSQLALFSQKELGPQDFSRMNSPLAESGPVLERSSTGMTSSSNTTAKDVVVPIRRDWTAVAFITVPLLSTLLALAAMGIFLTTSNPTAQQTVANLLSGMPAPAPAGLYLKKTELQLITLDSGEQIATLSGTIKNDTTRIFSSVVIEGLAFNKEGRSIGRSLGNVGSPINRARIKALSPEAIADLQTKVSKKFQVRPGEEKQFTLAISDARAEDVVFYSARLFQVN